MIVALISLSRGPGTSSWCWFFIVVGCFISVAGILQQRGPEESKNANTHY